MKTKSILLTVIAMSLFACNTTQQSPTVLQPSAVATVGDDMNTVAQKAITAFASAKEDGVSLSWALATMFNSYRDIIKTGSDVKALVKTWTGSKGQNLADRLALLFNTSSGTAAQKVATLAKAADAGAAKVEAKSGSTP